MKTDAKLIWDGEVVKVLGKKVVNKTSWELGLIVEGQAKLLCPIDLGYLAASITTASVEQSTEMGTVTPNTGKKRSGNAQSNYYKNIPDNFKKIDGPSDPNEVFVGTVVEYAPHIEFGTVKSDSQPFLRPALDLASGKMLTLLKYNGKTYFANYLEGGV